MVSGGVDASDAAFGPEGAFAPLNLWLWVMLNVRWSAIGESTRRLIAMAVSPARERLVVRAIAF